MPGDRDTIAEVSPDMLVILPAPNAGNDSILTFAMLLTDTLAEVSPLILIIAKAGKDTIRGRLLILTMADVSPDILVILPAPKAGSDSIFTLAMLLTDTLAEARPDMLIIARAGRETISGRLLILTIAEVSPLTLTVLPTPRAGRDSILTLAILLTDTEAEASPLMDIIANAGRDTIKGRLLIDTIAEVNPLTDKEVPAAKAGSEVILIDEFNPKSGREVILTEEFNPRSGRDVMVTDDPAAKAGRDRI